MKWTIVDDGGNLTARSTLDVKNVDKTEKDGDWLDVSCDRKFYELKIHGRKVDQPFLNGHFVSEYNKVCYWEEPGIENNLKKSGYYELLKDPHYGVKLGCCK